MGILGQAMAQNSMIGDGFGGRDWYAPFSVSVGSYSGFAVCGNDDQLYAWGLNAHGELGTGNKIHSNIPVKVTGMDDVFFYSTGYLSGCIRGDQSLWIWGGPFSLTPFKISDNVRHICGGIEALSMVKMDGTVWSVGSNFRGKFGNGNFGDSTIITSPQKMDNISTAVRVANGHYSTAVLLENGDVYASGWNYFGGLGQPSSVVDSKVPMKITTLKDIVDIKASSFGFSALDKNGDVYSWGQWIEGVNVFTPQKMPGLSNIVSISSKNDGWHFLALDKDKKCYAWGRNQYLQMGLGAETKFKTNPVLVATDVVDIMAGETFSYIVKTNGTLFATGQSKIASGASIWMNLVDKQRFSFTELDYEASPMNLCRLKRRVTLYIDTFTCENSQIELFGKTYTKGGRYFEVHNNADLDSVLIIDITIGKPSSSTQEVKLCGNEQWIVGKNVYTQAGTYVDTLVNASGCDSIVTTIITEGDPTFYTSDLTICFGETTSVGSEVYRETGTYVDTFTNLAGCDSIVTTNLTVLPEDLTVIPYDLCEGDVVDIKGKLYSKDTTMREVYTNTGGCDSIMEYQVRVHLTQIDSSTYLFCPWDAFVTEEKTYISLGTYTDTLQSFYGCDSIRIVRIDTFHDMTCYPAQWFAAEAFTPNGDKTNDIFRIKGQALESVTLRIYNRWGEKLYEGDGINEGWDGVYLGAPCQQDVYMYIANIMTAHRERVMFKGTITLLR